MSGLTKLALLSAGFAVCVASLGCTPYRIEHRKRPAFYKNASEADLPDEVILEDGTILRFSEHEPRQSGAAAGVVDSLATEKIQIREQSSDGRINLRAYAPEHVLAHAKNGIRMREYRLLWDQVLATETREAYRRAGKDYADFAQFCEQNRPKLMETFNRMGFGLYSPDVIQEAIGPDAIRYRLHPSLSQQFEFTEFDVVRESGGLKWLMIR